MRRKDRARATLARRGSRSVVPCSFAVVPAASGQDGHRSPVQARRAAVPTRCRREAGSRSNQMGPVLHRRRCALINARAGLSHPGGRDRQSDSSPDPCPRSQGRRRTARILGSTRIHRPRRPAYVPRLTAWSLIIDEHLRRTSSTMNMRRRRSDDRRRCRVRERLRSCRGVGGLTQLSAIYFAECDLDRVLRGTLLSSAIEPASEYHFEDPERLVQFSWFWLLRVVTLTETVSAQRPRISCSASKASTPLPGRSARAPSDWLVVACIDPWTTSAAVPPLQRRRIGAEELSHRFVQKLAGVARCPARPRLPRTAIRRHTGRLPWRAPWSHPAALGYLQTFPSRPSPSEVQMMLLSTPPSWPTHLITPTRCLGRPSTRGRTGRRPRVVRSAWPPAEPAWPVLPSMISTAAELVEAADFLGRLFRAAARLRCRSHATSHRSRRPTVAPVPRALQFAAAARSLVAACAAASARPWPRRRQLVQLDHQLGRCDTLSAELLPIARRALDLSRAPRGGGGSSSRRHDVDFHGRCLCPCTTRAKPPIVIHRRARSSTPAPSDELPGVSATVVAVLPHLSEQALTDARESSKFFFGGSSRLSPGDEDERKLEAAGLDHPRHGSWVDGALLPARDDPTAAGRSTSRAPAWVTGPPDQLPRSVPRPARTDAQRYVTKGRGQIGDTVRIAFRIPWPELQRLSRGGLPRSLLRHHSPYMLQQRQRNPNLSIEGAACPSERRIHFYLDIMLPPLAGAPRPCLSGLGWKQCWRLGRDAGDDHPRPRCIWFHVCRPVGPPPRRLPTFLSKRLEAVTMAARPIRWKSR